jgi:hypothetical protein
MEMQLILAMALQRFKIRLAPIKPSRSDPKPHSGQTWIEDDLNPYGIKHEYSQIFTEASLVQNSCVVASGPGQVVRGPLRPQYPILGKSHPVLSAIRLFGKYQLHRSRFLRITDMIPNFPHTAYCPTPKPHWSNTDAVYYNMADVPIVIDTDVNVAGLGESVWGK